MKKANEEYSLLYDFYGPLLGGRHREVFTLYNEENYSLSEIAAIIGVSRQAVHIAVTKAYEELEGYEEKLGLVAKHAAHEKTQDEIIVKIDGLLKNKTSAVSAEPDAAKTLRKVKKLVKELDL